MSGPPSEATPTFRLVTYNVRHGLGADGRVDVDRFAAAVAALDADVLALQEVEIASPRSLRVDQPRVAAAAMGAIAWRFAPTLRRRWRRWLRAAGTSGDSSRRRRPPRPHYGIALASRFPVERWWRLELPRAWRDEPRTALAARLVTPSGPLTVVATHLTVRAAATAGQLDMLLAAVGRLPGPVVVLGDLNLAPTDVARPGWRPLATALTHPVGRPVRQIDHILTDGGVVATSDARAVHTGLSDHRALAVEVRLT